jgi:hypothetical protein
VFGRIKKSINLLSSYRRQNPTARLQIVCLEWNCSLFSDPLKNETRACESKWARLKKHYKDVKFLGELSGFGWDEETSLLTAEPQAWAEVAKVIFMLL